MIMNKFLRFIEKIYKDNDVKDYNVLYYLLVNNVDSKNIESYFQGWINNYKSEQDKIRVFQADNWKYFCQFIHPNSKYCDASKMIKLYLSFETKYMDKAVQLIFDYLIKNNIVHLSKVSSTTRNDSIVIGVNNLFDARRIINFVNHNFFLKRHLVETNPFIYKEQGVGMTIDGRRSFNDELAKLLFNYFEYRKNNHINTKISIDELRSYIYSIYNNIQDETLRYIYKLIVGNLEGRMDENEFTDLVNDYQDNEVILLTIVRSLLYHKGHEYTSIALKKALKGDCSYLYETTDLTYDKKVLLSPDAIKRIIINKLRHNSNVIDTKEIVLFLTYINNTFNYSNEGKLKVLVIALQETIKKQGKEVSASNTARILFFEFIGKKNYDFITRDNNYRDFVKIAILPSEIEEILPSLRKKYQNYDDSDCQLLTTFIENEVLNEERKK